METATPNIIISGTSKGIGKVLALHYLEAGYTVFGCSRGESTIQHPSYHHTSVQLASEEEIIRWIRAVKNMATGRIDALIASGGMVSAARTGIAQDGADLLMQLTTNVQGTFSLCREVAKLMIRQKYGRIVTVSSMSAGLHTPGTSAYSAGKAAIAEFTKVLARELAPFGITCNTVAPSVYLTEATSELGEQIVHKALESLDIARPLTNDELLAPFIFFTSEQSSALTGQTLYLSFVP